MKNKILTGIMLLATGFIFMACSEDDDYSISNSAVVTSITTGDATVTAISATTTGTVLDLSQMATSTYQVGTVYGTSADPTTSGTKKVGTIDESGNLTTALSDLKEGTTYYYATYVTLQGKVTKYGEVKSFVATDADVATAAASSISACKALLNGQTNGVSDIQSAVSSGFKYSVSESDVQEGVELEVGSSAGDFSVAAEGLLPATTYYYVAYLKIADGYIYGNTQSFTTESQTMEYVDMGTSVLWAKSNIGAEAENEVGLLVGFGDQTFYNFSTNSNDYTPWDITGTEEDFIYNLSIDGDAKMKSYIPSALEFEELISKTTQTEETVGDVAGVRFTAKNGNSIFIPYAGYRVGAEKTNDGNGYYWTSNVTNINELYGKSLTLKSGSAAIGQSQLAYGLSLRSVRAEEPVEEGITIRNYNAVQGDIENNGNYRFDIYNQWDGSNTGSDDTSVLIPSEVNFKESISVTFTITGIGNTECDAFMVFADGTWTTSNWGYNEDGTGSVHITGDGTYTMKLYGTGSGLGVFAIDFIGLSSKVGAENINVKLNSCVMDDWGTKLAFDNSKLVTGDIENNGNFRADIYNQWDGSNTGDQEHCGVDISAVNFSKRIGVTFSVSGIGDTECNAFMVFADGTWTTSNWGYNEDGTGSVHITGDGTYTMSLAGTGSGFGVCAIDFVGLSTAVGAENVKVRISCIRVE